MQFKKTGYDAMIVRGKRRDSRFGSRSSTARSRFNDASAVVGQARHARLTETTGPEQQQAQRLVHRPGGRESEPHCRHHERPRARAGARRSRRGDGQQEPESHCGGRQRSDPRSSTRSSSNSCSMRARKSLAPAR
ncbi:MAG: hypothetical protein MZV64_18935 [Ignavibacteriales bacterium]|nr:hypothetical protein [Ignavibacteriales bacterium]